MVNSVIRMQCHQFAKTKTKHLDVLHGIYAQLGANNIFINTKIYIRMTLQTIYTNMYCACVS